MDAATRAGRISAGSTVLRVGLVGPSMASAHANAADALMRTPAWALRWRGAAIRRSGRDADCSPADRVAAAIVELSREAQVCSMCYRPVTRRPRVC